MQAATRGVTASSMHTSSYKLLLRPAWFLLNSALLLTWEYEQPAGTTPSAPSSTTFRPRIGRPSACVASCTAAKHSLSAALRCPLGQPLSCPGLSAMRGSRAQPEVGAVADPREDKAAGAPGAGTAGAAASNICEGKNV